MTLRQQYGRLYRTWSGMKGRCYCSSNISYPYYGARGVKVCDEWQRFEPFCKWALENGWQEGLSIERIDPSGNYCPENCKWIPLNKQQRNKRRTRYLAINGERHPIVHWCDLTGIDRHTIYEWIDLHGEEYAREKIESALANGYHPNPIPSGQTIYVLCPELKAFDSMRQACKELGIERKTASKYLDTGNYYKGYLFYTAKSISRRNELDGMPLDFIPFKEKIIHKDAKYLTVNGVTKRANEWDKMLGAKIKIVAHWIRLCGEEVAAAKVKESLEKGYERSAPYCPGVPITHIESGKSFPSIKSAARFFNICRDNIKTSLRSGKPSSVGTFIFKQ